MSEHFPHQNIRRRAHVSGLVQGVGFRPFVWREATSRGLSGWVGNDASGVVLEVEGRAATVHALLEALHTPPLLARVDEVRHEDLEPLGDQGFEVRVSAMGGARTAQVSPESTTCDDCLRELLDPTDRRFGYPFLNCTSCGPRYTIVESVPYDRARTTMSRYTMCEVCQAEYDDPADRRFHAEPTCCRSCGPQLRLVHAVGAVIDGDPIAGAVEVLRSGGVLAVKGLGGYHLAVDARDEAAVSTLRTRKHREDRPFALMVPSLASAQELCLVTSAERDLLTSRARPIVLLTRRGEVADAVAPGSPSLGVMLPYTPVHALLLAAFGGPLVMTSGNLSAEPIAYQDEDAALRLGRIADALLLHDRAIRTRVDDSVVKVVGDRLVPIRRSRGYVPDPVLLPVESPVPVLACGAAMKSTFALVRGRQCVVSHHVGDLQDYATYASYVEGVAHLSALLDLSPQVVAHDLHPDYPSTRYAQELDGVELLGVQHHHAHIASCLADNGHSGPVIGVAFDGLGLGSDGTAWGGEVLVADLVGFTRVGHLSPVPMPGGDQATRQPWRMALAHLQTAHLDATGLAVATRQGARWGQVLAATLAGLNAPLTSSAGRLFDAVSALLGIRDVVTYEGQAAIELEHVADPGESGSYAVPVRDGVIDCAALVRALVEDLARRTPVPVIAARFHTSLAAAVAEVCEGVRDSHGSGTVALSGGVFQNGLLLQRCLDLLEGRGFVVLTHRQVPPNDGGISLGQAAVAAALLRARG